MSVRVRKAIGSVGILVFLLAYVAAAATIGDWVPRFWLAKLVYYLVVGMAWGIPILPLITWMNREP